jgi:hypothetical protein
LRRFVSFPERRPHFGWPEVGHPHSELNNRAGSELSTRRFRDDPDTNAHTREDEKSRDTA